MACLNLYLIFIVSTFCTLNIEIKKLYYICFDFSTLKCSISSGFAYLLKCKYRKLYKMSYEEKCLILFLVLISMPFI